MENERIRTRGPIGVWGTVFIVVYVAAVVLAVLWTMEII